MKQNKKIFRMFVVTERFRRNPIINFYDKSIPKGISNESAVSPILDCSVSPKGILAYKYFSTMTEEKQFVNNSEYANISTPNSATTVTLTQEFFNDFEKVKTYDEEYGIVVTNLLEILKRQFSNIYQEVEELKLGYDKTDKLYDVLWQTHDLAKVIHEKVGTQMFIDVENCVHHLKESLTNKKIA